MLNYQQIEQHPESLTKIQPCISNYKLEWKNFQQQIDDWRKLRKKM